MPPQLREFRWRTDRDAFLAAQTEVYEINFPGFHMNAEFLRDYDQQLRKALRSSGERVLVLEDESGLAGFIWISLISTMVEPFVGYIKNVYIAPRLRGKGYARMLLSAAENWFRERGCRKSTLDASMCNPRALSVYEAGGYRSARVRMEKSLLQDEE